MLNSVLIKEWFEKSGLSKEEFAVRIERSLGTVNNLLAGKGGLEAQTLANVARVMGKQMEDLLLPRAARKAS